jgi:hypothetical protein
LRRGGRAGDGERGQSSKNDQWKKQQHRSGKTTGEGRGRSRERGKAQGRIKGYFSCKSVTFSNCYGRGAGSAQVGRNS